MWCGAGSYRSCRSDRDLGPIRIGPRGHHREGAATPRVPHRGTRRCLRRQRRHGIVLRPAAEERPRPAALERSTRPASRDHHLDRTDSSRSHRRSRSSRCSTTTTSRCSSRAKRESAAPVSRGARRHPDHRDNCPSTADKATGDQMALCVSRALSERLQIEWRACSVRHVWEPRRNPQPPTHRITPAVSPTPSQQPRRQRPRRRARGEEPRSPRTRPGATGKRARLSCPRPRRRFRR